MDTAVALVDAYLKVNGYFTVTEYPLIESIGKHSRVATDLDVLAFRFPLAGSEIRSRRRRMSASVSFEPDPELGAKPGSADMIVGEVKEGFAGFNPAARNPMVIAAALARFGCCSAEDSKRLAEDLLHKGRAVTPSGHAVRMIAFGSREGLPNRWHVISMHHIFQFLTDYMNRDWRELRLADFKHPAMSFLALLKKSKRGSADDSQ